MSSLAFLPLNEVAARIASREVSPVEVTEAVLRQVDEHAARLNPFITPTPDLALDMARAAERRIAAAENLGPLHGIPIVLKDLLSTRGTRTTGGSAVLRDWIPEDDATVVTLLREAGAVFIGKTGMPEFALHPTSLNPFYGAVRNPWNPDFDTGGSSSGTGAAVAAGMAYCGPGSDTGGSIRIPAAACGLVGLKPTWGRVSLRGVLPLCAGHDHVGPMARTVRDAALLMQALAAYDPRDPFSRDAPVDDYLTELEGSVAGRRIAYLMDDGGPEVEPSIADAVRAGLATLEAAGARIDEVELPYLDRLWREPLAPLEEAESALDYARYLPQRSDELSAEFREFITRGAQRTGTEIVAAQRELEHALHQIERALRDVDLLVSPTLSVYPPAAGEELVELCRFTAIWDLNGWPAISVPVGIGELGLPIGLQIVGKPWNEALVLRTARVVERGYALTFPPPLPATAS
jgi:aspartyl-tRNA(Asn)/glutamyl-tRNA(Gln) amidotransferase subunit A